MNGNQTPGNDPALARLAERGASPAQIADALLACWARLHGALSPIVGERGVAALCSRAMHLTVAEHAWLASVPAHAEGAIDLPALRAAMQARHGVEPAAAGDAFLHNFTELLSSLVGQPLAARLIGPVRIEPTSGDAAQDP